MQSFVNNSRNTAINKEKVDASELLANLEEFFPRKYMNTFIQF